MPAPICTISWHNTNENTEFSFQLYNSINIHTHLRASAATVIEWKGSWTASLYAAEHGLLLARAVPYEARYNLSSHRGVDRPFKLGTTPKLHVFAKPNNGGGGGGDGGGGDGDGDGTTTTVVKAPREIQLCCRHELHIVIPSEEEEYDVDGSGSGNNGGGVSSATVCSLDQILGGDAIEEIIRASCVPDGIRVEVPARQILEIHESHGTSRIAVFLVVYCGERYPVTREDADRWRQVAEREVEKYVPLRENRRGRTVSRPFPYPALHPEIKYHTTGKR